MSYRFESGEAVPAASRRVAAEQLAQALESLREEGDRAEAVHDARKRLKKLRALLRLLRDDLGGTAYKRENRRFRDAGRALSGVRDAEVLVETLDQLRGHFDGVLLARAFAGARRELMRRQEAATRRVLEEGERDAEVAAELEAAQARLADWPLESEGWPAVAGGLERVYARGRDAFAEVCEDSGDAAAFHEWRKRVKDLWYHLRLLREVWPEPMKAARDEAKALSDLLGDDHDLVVLEETLRAEPEAFGGTEERAALLGLIAERSAQLRAAAQPLGERLYAEKPSRFARRVERYWRAWQAEQATPAIAVQAAAK